MRSPSTLKVSAQPTPQYGQTDSTCRSSVRGRIGTTLIGLFVSAPVGHAATHSPHVTHEASPFHGLDPSQVSYAGGTLTANGTAVTFGWLLTTVGVPVVEATATSPKNGNKDFEYRSFGAHFCEVRVNRWTAETRVSRYVSVIDAGTVVNEKTARNHVERTYAKIGVSNRIGASMYALQNGLVNNA